MKTNDFIHRTYDRLFYRDPVHVGARAAFNRLSRAEKTAVRLQHGDDIITWYTQRILQSLIDSMRERRTRLAGLAEPYVS